MTCLKLTLPAAATAPALLTLPQPLTARALFEIERAVAGTLAMLRRDLSDAGMGTVPAHDPSGSDAAEIEYASWMPDPGAMEFASWVAQLRTSVR